MTGYRLGIDLGSTSLGWCALCLQDGKPTSILDMGVRIFDDGRDAKTKTPLAVERREKRSQRRRRDRLLRRKRKLIVVPDLVWNSWSCVSSGMEKKITTWFIDGHKRKAIGLLHFF